MNLKSLMNGLLVSNKVVITVDKMEAARSTMVSIGSLNDFLRPLKYHQEIEFSQNNG